MRFDFTARTILVTGAASGIGQAIARSFLDAGARVLATDVDEAALAAVIVPTDAAARWQCHRLDAGCAEDIARFFARLSAQGEDLDVLVNNAGLARLEPIATMTPEAIDLQFAVLLKGPMLAARHALPLLERREGSIVNIASIAAIIQAGGHAGYSACKAGLVKFTRDLVKEHPRVRSNVILPGFIDTPILRAYGEGEALEQIKRDIAARVPLGHLGRPEDIAGATLFLASAQARYISGAALVVDGGVTCTSLEGM